VLPEFFVVLYHIVWHAVVAALHACPMVANIVLAQLLFNYPECSGSVPSNTAAGVFVIIGLFCLVYPASMLVFLLIDILGKWIIIGR
jgi:hypothetical protein